MSAGASDCQDRVARLLDQLTRLARGLQFSDGLNPAQWDCLRFISRANAHSRTPGGIATFLGTTKGTASQTIIALEGKGFVRREKDTCDRRICRLVITNAGVAKLENDPLRSVRQAAERHGGDARRRPRAARLRPSYPPRLSRVRRLLQVRTLYRVGG